MRQRWATKVGVGLLMTLAAITGVVATPATAAGPIAQLPTADPANFTPNVLNGEVDSIWQVGNTVIVGGTFTSIANATSNGGQTYNRSRLASFNATTGVVNTGFAPVFNGAVTTVLSAGDGTTLFVAGNFTTVNGVTRQRVARINLATGALVTSFNAGTIGASVRDAKLVGNELFIGGAFAAVAGQARQRLASVNATTGALTTRLNVAIAGTQNGGTTQVFKMEVTPAGDRLMLIGNFAQVGGLDRRQIAMLDLSAAPATVHPWQTNFYTSTCASAFDAYIRDLDISEDGTFAVVSTTGAYRANTSCDTIARFEVYTSQSGLNPTWIDYTGGDTSYAVEIHDGVAFVGGHQRWFNNPLARDAAGPGAIPREGIAALDVLNGLPYSWNPGRDRGVGVFDFHVTDAGVWAGSDTTRWGGETRQRLAFFPWSGGSFVPESLTAALPGEVYLLGRTSGTTAQQNEVRHVPYSGSGAPGPTVTNAGTVAWSQVRGSFMVNDELFTFHSDGTFQRRAFDGTTFGTATTVNIYANNISSELASMSGVFFDPSNSRIYYTLTGQSSLFYRYFTPESRVIGATRFSATGTVASLNPSRVRGMFMSGGQIWFGDNNSGSLLRIGFAGGVVSGSATTADNSIDWRGRAMFLDGEPGVAPNPSPVAGFSVSCVQLSCTFTSTSTDDGAIVSSAWTFGDGASGSGASVVHAFAQAGTYDVSLTVTDDDGAVDTATQPVVVSAPGNPPPVAGFSVSCVQLSCTFTSTSTDDGAIVSSAWTFGDGGSGSGASVVHAFAQAGTYDVSLTVTDDDGAVDTATQSLPVSDASAQVAFRAATSVNGGGLTAPIVVPQAVQPGDQLVLIVTANVAATIDAPPGWTVVATQTDGSPDMRSSVFTFTAVPGTAGSTVAATITGTAVPKSVRVLVAYSGAAAPTVVASSVMGASSTTLASPVVNVSVPGSIVLGHWADKTATNTGWTLPASVTQRTATVGSGSGRLVAAAGDAPAAPGPWPGVAATSSVAGTKGIAWSIVLAPVTP